MILTRTSILATVIPLLLLACQITNDTGSSTSAAPENATFWQLADDSELRIALNPWPVTSGASVRLTVQATTGDWAEDKSLVERVLFGVSTSTQGPASPAPMRFTRVDSEGNRFFEADMTLPRGTSYLHIRAEGSNFKGGSAGELEPWKIEAK